MKKTKNLFGLFVAGSVLALTSCGFRVTSPTPSDVTATYNGFSSNASGQLIIKVSFSDPVNQNTVVARKTLLLKFTKNANANATLSWSLDSKVLTITTVDTRDNLMSFQPDDGFTLTLIGRDRGDGVVKSTGGAALDGDYDGNAGGDYRKGFFIIG
jgi:hypothetical protein